MSASTACPSCDELRALLGGNLPDDEQSRITGHLDRCAGCQKTLEAIAVGDSALVAVLCEACHDKPSSGSAFWPAVRELEQPTASVTNTFTPHGPSASETPLEVKLDFLAPAEKPGQLGKLAHFEVLQVVGRGGMGVVLHAFDPCLQRDIAIKVLAPELAGNELARKRFCREARTAARLSHDNLVAVHSVDEDETSELPFLVMQYVAGEALDQRLSRLGRLSIPEVVRIGAQAAAGLAAAHSIGLIHRDIKPGNILLEASTDKVKLTDFGLARAAEDVRLTSTGFVSGTPLYMSPEQARGEEADHRSDLYSFGAVMYEMLAARPPFEGKSPLAVLRQVADEPHPPVRGANPNAPDWLVAVIDRLLEKNPDDRFQSAAEVAELLRQEYARLQPQSPITSTALSSRRVRALGPPRRWPARLAIGAALVAAGMVLGGLLVWALGLSNNSGGDAAAVATPRMTLNGNSGPVWSVAFSPDGGTLAMAIEDARVLLWDLKGQRIAGTLTGHRAAIWTVDFSKDGSRLVTASDDGDVRLWDATTGEPLATRFIHAGSVRSVALSPDGKQVAAAGRTGTIYLWDLKLENTVWMREQGGSAYAVAFSPDGRTIASAGSNKEVKLWDVATGHDRLTLPGHNGPVYAVAYSPDGRRLASASWDGTVRLWDADSGEPGPVLRGHEHDVWSVSFGKDGKTLASAGTDGMVRLWDVESGRETASFKGHRTAVHTVRFDGDGERLASGARDGTAKVWDVGRN
jgi:eukaryotic-like serine/threonine-protein kinase